ncbi:MAG: LamG domain-containing protein [bacterium]|nr:LamG domain-containing protein [bacterium]
MYGRQKKIIIAATVLGIFSAGFYWRQPLAEATMKLLKVAQGIVRIRSSPKNGLVGHWNFDECDTCTTTTDRSGNNNAGTMYDNVTVANLHTASGRVGNAASFDGSNDYIALTQSATLKPTTAFTVSAWVKRTANMVTWSGIFASPEASNSTGGFFLTGLSTNVIRLYIFNGVWVTADSKTVLAANQWYHVAATWTGSFMNVYINGILDMTPVANSGIGYGTTARNAEIGRYSAYGNFPGPIDDVRIYNRALSVDEIKRLYEEGSYRTTINANQNSSFNNGLVGMWSFNGPDVNWASASAEILDKSGNGNNGDAVGLTNKSVRAGVVGQALSFNGSSDYVAVPASSSLSLGTTMTISMWFNRRSTTGLQALASSNKYSAVGFNGNWILRITSGTVLDFVSYDGQSNQEWGQFAFTINNNVWNHVVVSINGSTVTAYLNGAPSVSGTFAHTKALIDAGVSGMRIGDDLNWSNVPFNGQIDDVRIYNRALNATEINELYLSSARQ